jgi:hypothetical protein
MMPAVVHAQRLPRQRLSLVQIAISLHPTVSELIPTLLSDLKPLA